MNIIKNYSIKILKCSIKIDNIANIYYELSDEELTERFNASIKIDQDICKIKELPIAGYDDESDSSYIEYPDGRRVYPNEK